MGGAPASSPALLVGHSPGDLLSHSPEEEGRGGDGVGMGGYNGGPASLPPSSAIASLDPKGPPAPNARRPGGKRAVMRPGSAGSGSHACPCTFHRARSESAPSQRQVASQPGNQARLASEESKGDGAARPSGPDKDRPGAMEAIAKATASTACPGWAGQRVNC